MGWIQITEHKALFIICHSAASNVQLLSSVKLNSNLNSHEYTWEKPWSYKCLSWFNIHDLCATVRGQSFLTQLQNMEWPIYWLKKLIIQHFSPSWNVKNSQGLDGKKASSNNPSLLLNLKLSHRFTGWCAWNSWQIKSNKHNQGLTWLVKIWNKTINNCRQAVSARGFLATTIIKTHGKKCKRRS